MSNDFPQPAASSQQPAASRLNKRHNRRKPHLAWEQAEVASGGLYARDIECIAKKFPKLTPMELRVCVLVKEKLPNWRIADILGIDERTVENHRTIARRVMKIPHGKSLTAVLARL